MKKITILIVLALLCLNFNSLAKLKPLPKGLQIGDKLPDLVFTEVLNSSSKSLQLSQFRGKWLIIDFWATWCTSCIKNFPNVDQVAAEFNGRITVLAVTNEPKATVAKFLKSPAGASLRFPTVIADTILKQLFPHYFVPHYVWVAPDGRIAAITGTEALSTAFAKKLMDGTQQATQVKKDMDASRPLFLSTDYPQDNHLQYYSIFSKGRYSGMGMGGRFRRTNGIVHGRAQTNVRLLRLFENAIRPLFEQLGDEYDAKRLQLQVRDTSLITGDLSHMTTDSNFYNYDLIVPLSQADSLYQIMLAELNRYSGYKGFIKKQLVDCLVLVQMGNNGHLKTKGGDAKTIDFTQVPSKMVNNPVSNLVLQVNQLAVTRLPIIDETGITYNIDITIPTKITDLQDLITGLRSAGLDLKPARRMINIFCLQDNHPIEYGMSPKP